MLQRLADLLGHARRRPHSPRTALHRRRSQGIRGLLRVQALHALPARLASPDRDVEPACHGTAFDVFLILRFGALPLYPSTAVAPRRQCSSLHFIYGAGFAPLASTAILAPTLATRLTWLWFRLAPRERSRLPLGGTGGFVQLSPQPLVFAPQTLVLLAELCVLPFPFPLGLFPLVLLLLWHL